MRVICWGVGGVEVGVGKRKGGSGSRLAIVVMRWRGRRWSSIWCGVGGGGEGDVAGTGRWGLVFVWWVKAEFRVSCSIMV